MNKHLLEERNLKPLEDENERHELDEEELYSAVMGFNNITINTSRIWEL